MAIKKAPETVTTKTGEQVTLNYCRKCMQNLPAREFYESIDAGLIDSNGKFSVCKTCIQKIYDEIFDTTQSVEKTIHKMCTSLNVKFSNEAVSATRAHVNTLLQNGKQVKAIFSIFLMKLVATKKTMDKSGVNDFQYEDVGAVYTSEIVNIKEIPIPEDVVKFWGRDRTREEIEFLENEYANFKQTHATETYTQITLLKEVCYTLLNIKNLRAAGDDTQKAVRELQQLMGNLAISPKSINTAKSSISDVGECFGMWIQDIEREEPAQWLKTDPRGDIYRDVADTDDYFQKYTVRPLKNLILTSKDFNLGDEEERDDDLALDNGVFDTTSVDDGELED